MLVEGCNKDYFFPSYAWKNQAFRCLYSGTTKKISSLSVLRARHCQSNGSVCFSGTGRTNCKHHIVLSLIYQLSVDLEYVPNRFPLNHKY